MNRPTSRTAEVSATRRKVIRASFAVPALATVASGSALAATSASCFAKQLARPGPGTYPPVSTSANPDTYLRVQLASLTPNGNNAVPVYYVDGDTLAATLGSTMVRAASYTLSAGKFQKFDIATNLEVDGVLSTSPLNGNGNNLTYNKQSGRFAALRFDSTGKVVGVGASTSTGMSAVQASCWSSLAP